MTVRSKASLVLLALCFACSASPANSGNTSDAGGTHASADGGTAREPPVYTSADGGTISCHADSDCPTSGFSECGCPGQHELSVHCQSSVCICQFHADNQACGDACQCGSGLCTDIGICCPSPLNRAQGASCDSDCECGSGTCDVIAGHCL